MWCQPEIPLFFPSVNFLRRILHACLKTFANKICHPPPKKSILSRWNMWYKVSIRSVSLLKCDMMWFSRIRFRMFENFSWFLVSNYSIGRKWPLRCWIVIQIPRKIPQILDLMRISDMSCANTPEAQRPRPLAGSAANMLVQHSAHSRLHDPWLIQLQHSIRLYYARLMCVYICVSLNYLLDSPLCIFIFVFPQAH